MLELTLGVITLSATTVLSFIVWLIKRKKDFKKLWNAIKSEKVGVAMDKKTFKLKYAFYKKLIKLLIKSIEEKYLRDVFKDGEADYEKMVKEILSFINDVDVVTGEVGK